MSVNEKMTAVADEIRTLSGTLDKLSLDEMAVQAKNANNEVDTQDILIEQIKAAIQGKATSDRYDEGYADGLAARTYETWTIAYVDGTIEEREVALL